MSDKEAPETSPKQDDNAKKRRQNHQRPSSPSSPKQRFKEKNGSRRRRGWEEPAPELGADVAPGSYAHEGLRQLLGIDIPSDLVATSVDEGRLPTKRKVAMLVGYIGTNYGGFQMNADQRTVQAEIELALLKAKLLSASNFGYPFKYNWSTSGRTDKGVHACAQVCGAKLHLGDSGDTEAGMDAVRDCINAHLPDDIRVLHLLRTTRNFCAKTMRAHVRYQYMIPSFCLHPNLHQLFVDHGITWNISNTSNRYRQANDPLSADELQTMQAALSSYRATPDQLERLQQALTLLQGTHSFHHFTKSVTASDAKATRYIVKYECLAPVVMSNGTEWIPTQVLGQSFLVYQVRKMTSLVIDVARGVAPMSVVEQALLTDSNIRLNVAPPHALFKEMSYYGGYNQKKRPSNPELMDLEWEKDGTAVQGRWMDFRARVMETIVQEEAKEGNFIKYMFNQEFIFGWKQHYRLRDKVGVACDDDGDNALSKSSIS